MIFLPSEWELRQFPIRISALVGEIIPRDRTWHYIGNEPAGFAVAVDNLIGAGTGRSCFFDARTRIPRAFGKINRLSIRCRCGRFRFCARRQSDDR